MGRLELGKKGIVKTVEMEPRMAEDELKLTSRDGTRGNTPSSTSGITTAEMISNVRIWLWIQLIAAIHSANLSAGV